MLRDILAAALDADADMEISYVDSQLHQLDNRVFEISDLIITSMDNDKLIARLDSLLVVNPHLAIINLSRSGKTGRLMRFQRTDESLGDALLERILQVAHNSFHSFHYR